MSEAVYLKLLCLVNVQSRWNELAQTAELCGDPYRCVFASARPLYENSGRPVWCRKVARRALLWRRNFCFLFRFFSPWLLVDTATAPGNWSWAMVTVASSNTRMRSRVAQVLCVHIFVCTFVSYCLELEPKCNQVRQCFWISASSYFKPCFAVLTLLSIIPPVNKCIASFGLLAFSCICRYVTCLHT